jgi:hypothetical protein
VDIEAALRPLIVGEFGAEERPEILAMGPMFQVRQFVDDDVFKHPLWREDEPIKVD